VFGVGVSAEVFSGVAVAMSMYSLWRTSLQRADLRVFVSPLIRYASPYQNSVFEVFEIPLTVVNEGAQTGTILSFDLEVTNSQNGASKLFYSAGLGPWSLARVKGEGLTPFTPVSLTGRSSQSETNTVLRQKRFPGDADCRGACAIPVRHDASDSSAPRSFAPETETAHV
jgi:hypothetical protein